MFVVAYRVHAEDIQKFQSKGLLWNIVKLFPPVGGIVDTLKKLLHKAFAGSFEPHIKEPVEVVDSGGNDLQFSGGKAQHFSHHAERSVDLVAKAHSFDFGVIFEIGANGGHGVGKTHQPCLRRIFFNGFAKCAVQIDLPEPVYQSPGTAAFPFDLVDAVFFRDPEIIDPVGVAVLFAGADDIIAPFNRLFQRKGTFKFYMGIAFSEKFLHCRHGGSQPGGIRIVKHELPFRKEGIAHQLLSHRKDKS